jgi:hypothetical protein
MGDSIRKGRFGLALALSLFAFAQGAFAQNLLEVRRVGAAPKLDAEVDATWQQAVPLKATVVGGANLPGGRTEVSLRALSAGDSIYFLVQYADPTESMRRNPYRKQADGSWLRVSDPNDKGGDDQSAYEDKFAMIWAIRSPAFEKSGCMASCHVGDAGKPYGSKYLPAGEIADLWNAKSVSVGTVGQMDDQYLDDARYDKERSPEAGRKYDAKVSGGYTDNRLLNGKPEFALKDNRPAPPYWIAATQKAAFDDAKYQAGAELPSIVVSPFVGDRGDISLAQRWKDGIWTLEFGRKLVTGSKTDVQFDDRSKAYAFGLAVFDNAQVRHAFAPAVLTLRFKD